MSGEHWPFHQAPNVAAVTTRAVVETGAPILLVVHYEEDDSWAFLTGDAFRGSGRAPHQYGGGALSGCNSPLDRGSPLGMDRPERNDRGTVAT
jgi:hypothetical protein